MLHAGEVPPAARAHCGGDADPGAPSSTTRCEDPVEEVMLLVGGLGLAVDSCRLCSPRSSTSATSTSPFMTSWTSKGNGRSHMGPLPCAGSEDRVGARPRRAGGCPKDHFCDLVDAAVQDLVDIERMEKWRRPGGNIGFPVLVLVVYMAAFGAYI